MALPNEHLLTFSQYKDAKTLFEAIQARFSRNDAIKKTQKTLLKQMYKNFNASSTESLYFIFNMLHKIVSQLAILGENISQEDLNMKFLRSLPFEWNTYVVVWRNKADLDTMSIDDLYNNFKIVEQEVKRTVTTSSSLGSQNLAFLSSPSSTNEVDTANIQANQPNGSQLVHEDLEQIHEDNLEEMDLKWQLALLSMRARMYFQRAGKKITINGSDTVGYDKTKVECFNCHKMGHFAREFRSSRNQESRPRNQDNSKKTVNVEDTCSKVMVAIDGAGFDYSYMADDEAPINMALMAISDSKEVKYLITVEHVLGFASYNAVAPPPTGLFTPSTIDLSKYGLEEFQHPEFKGYGPKANWVSDSDEDESEVMVLKSDNVQHKPEQANQPRKVSQNPRNNRTNWNEMRTQKLGVRNFTPTAVLTKSEIVPTSTARQSSSRAATPVSVAMPINTAAPKPLVNVAKPRQNALQKSHSLSRRPFY
uniref:Uncharacterized protein n=1 Tax=Tanacetum cinerariifolium TaxID=118510 RepID=A0A6L2JTZ3_TANCI|nr:hypothetical protein [Tanacetum cinerariifolium]